MPSAVWHCVAIEVASCCCLFPGGSGGSAGLGGGGALPSCVCQPALWGAGRGAVAVIRVLLCPGGGSACAQPRLASPRPAAASCPLGPCPGWHTTVAREGLVLGRWGPWGEPGAAPPGSATLCPSQMSYELWRDLEEESEGDSQGRKPEIGNVFLMDRGRLE